MMKRLLTLFLGIILTGTVFAVKYGEVYRLDMKYGYEHPKEYAWKVVVEGICPPEIRVKAISHDGYICHWDMDNYSRYFKSIPEDLFVRIYRLEPSKR